MSNKELNLGLRKFKLHNFSQNVRNQIHICICVCRTLLSVMCLDLYLCAMGNLLKEDRHEGTEYLFLTFFNMKNKVCFFGLKFQEN